MYTCASDIKVIQELILCLLIRERLKQDYLCRKFVSCMFKCVKNRDIAV